MDVTAVAWRKSSYSGDNGGNCVEVGTAGPAMAVRDSKHPDGPLLAFAADVWGGFTEQVKATARTRISTGNAEAVPSDQGAIWPVSGTCRPVNALP